MTCFAGGKVASGKSKNIIIGLFFNKKGWQNSLKGAKQEFESFTSQVKTLASGTLQTLAHMNLAAQGIQSAFGAIKNAALGPIQLAAAAETASIKIGTMLGSMDRANQLINSIKKIQSPFDATDLQENAVLLLSYGVNVRHVAKDIEMLTNIAAGDSNKLKTMVAVLGQINSAGKLLTQDFKQLLGQGFNPLLYLSRMTGKSMEELGDAMSRGEITVNEVRQAIEFATSAGQEYYQMNEKISGTLGGVWTTLQTTITAILTEIGEEVVQAFDLKNAIANTNELVDTFRSHFMPVIKNSLKILADLSKVFLSVGTATLNTIIAMREYIQLLASIVIGYAAAKSAVAAYLVVTKSITAAVWLWNNTSKALAATQAFLLALTGPRGWAMVAGATLAAGAAYAGLEYISGQLSKTTEQVVEKENEAADAIAEVATQSTAAASAMAELARQQEGAQKSAEDLVKSLQFDLRTHGQSSFDKQVIKLSDEGAHPATLNQAKRIYDQIAALDDLEKAKAAALEVEKKAEEERKKNHEWWQKRQADELKSLQNRADQIVNSHRTEQEIYEDTIKEIKKLQNTYDDNGLALLDNEQAERAMAAARKRLEDSQNKNQSKPKDGPLFGSLALAGSTEAYKQIISHQFGGDNSLISVNKQQLAEQKKQTAASEKTAVAVDKLSQQKTSYADLPS